MSTIFTENLPHLDVHGLDRLTTIMLLKDFINDNIILKNKYIVVVHGKGTGALKEEITAYLKRCKNIKSYYLSSYNIGQTIIELF
ncbi:MAG: Smr/MutS family protein [Bacilli bacterium]